MISGSFRDPSGYVFEENGIVCRRVSGTYKDTLKRVMECGLYQDLVDSELMIPFKVLDESTIIPEQLAFISYPYEWCFSQLKDAALVTLEIAKRALNYSMVLKDASTYNIQFHKGKPMLIDHLSYGAYQEGEPWIAYKQFCEHFLAPLTLMSYKDIRLGQLLRIHIDGIPLDLVNSLLPLRANLNYHLLLHIKAHSASQRHYEDKSLGKKRISHTSLLGIIDSLESCIEKLNWKPKGTWADYYSEDSEYTKHKKELVGTFLHKVNPRVVWDLGANIGLFSQIAGRNGAQVISFDSDPACVEKHYLNGRRPNILPLLLDLINPSPGIGWENQERMSLKERKGADIVLALALVHHLTISNNLPLGMIANFLRDICHFLIVEFVPKEDPKVQKLLSTREDIFPNYTQEAFEEEFGKFFSMLESRVIEGSNRILYLMEIRG